MGRADIFLPPFRDGVGMQVSDQQDDYGKSLDMARGHMGAGEAGSRWSRVRFITG